MKAIRKIGKASDHGKLFQIFKKGVFSEQGT